MWRLIGSVWLIAFAFAQNTLVINYSLQDQRPPVARPNTPWLFSLLPDTFSPASSGSLTYSAQDLPAWVTFDGTALAFSGTPSSSDVASTYVTLAATDESGNTGQGSFQLLVSDLPAPTVQDPVASQLPNGTSLSHACVLNYNGWLRVPPGLNFSISLADDTFADANNNHIYYTAYQTNTTTLPSWLQFDQRTLHFTGDATGDDSGTYPITLFGSNVDNYGDVKQEFTVLIDQHAFDLDNPLPALNATPGGPVNYTIPITGLSIDYMPVVASNVSHIIADTSAFPSLAFDANSLTLTGNLTGSTADSIPVSFRSSYGQTLNTTLSVNRLASLFSSSTLNELSLKKGQEFSVSLSDYLSHPAQQDATTNGTSAQIESVEFQPSEAASWAKFDPSSQTLSGTPPKDAPYDHVNVLLHASSTSTDQTDAATLPIDLTGKHAKNKALAIGLGVGLGLLGLLLLLGLLFCCCKRRKEKKEQRQQDPASDVYISSSDLMTPAMKSSPFVDDKQHFEEVEVEPSRPLSKIRNVSSGPKRFEMMRVFGSRQSGLHREVSSDSFGLGISSPDHQQHVVMLDNGQSTYVADTTDTQSDLTSLRSKGSSSVFYPDTSHKDLREAKQYPVGRASVSTLSTLSSVAVTRESSIERSREAAESELGYLSDVPRQRREWARMSPNLDSAPHSLPPSPITNEFDPFIPAPADEPAATSFFGAIRSVRKTNAPAALKLQSAPHAAPAQFKPKAVVDSPRTSLASRFVPFASTNRRASSPPQSLNDAAVEDAIESEQNTARYSVPYYPDEAGAGLTSPIFFVPPGLPQSAAQSPPASRSASPSRRHDGSNVVRVFADVGKPFHFTPPIYPPPAMSSPTRRNRNQVRYVAVTDYPDDPSRDRKPLPEWLNFSEADIELWGIARAENLGESFAFQLLKVPNTQVATERGEEQRVGRFVIEVLNRSSRVEEGAVRVVRY